MGASGSATTGVNSIWASTSRSRSMPGASSVKIILPSRSSKTARSVTYRIRWPRRAASAPLNVICSTAETNFLEFALLGDSEPAVAGCDLQTSGGERTAVDDRLRSLGDVDKAAWPHVTAAEAAHVDVAMLVGLRQAQEGDVEAPAVVPVEHGQLLDVCLGVARRAEEQVRPRCTAHRAGLGGKGHHLVDPLLGGQPAHGVGIADAEVDDRTGDELHGRTPDHHGAPTQGRRLGRRQGDPQVPGQRRVKAAGRLGMEIGRGGDHHVIDQRGGDPHMLRVQGAGLGRVLYLGDHDAAAVLGRLGHRS